MTQPRQWQRWSRPVRRGGDGASLAAAYHRLVTIVFLMLSVLALGVVLAVIVSRTSAPGVEASVTTASFAGLPTGPLFRPDLDQVRLDLAFRGYRMDQVDAMLTRLGDELSLRDEEINRLRHGQEHHGDL